MVVIQPVSSEDKLTVLRDVYKKHTEELRAIEDSQMKLTGLLLGVFSAGVSLLAKETSPLHTNGKFALTAVALAVLLFGTVYTHFRSRARRSTRNLLVRCEIALGFYETGIYIPEEALYRPELKQFASAGWWLANIIAIVWLAAAVFFWLLWLK